MTARTKRAARVDPGAIPGRRTAASTFLGHVAGFSPDTVPSTINNYPGQGSPISRRLAQSRHSRPTPRITIGDVYSSVYELELHRGDFEIILFCYREGKATVTRMRQRLRPGQVALTRSLEHLTRIGLIRLVESPTFPFAKSYDLTDWGREFAETPLRAWPHVLAE